MKRVLLLSISCVLIGMSCDTDDYTSNKFNIGYTPVYMDSLEYMQSIKTLAPRIADSSKYLPFKGYKLKMAPDSGIYVQDSITDVNIAFINTPSILNFNTVIGTIEYQTTLGEFTLNTTNFPQVDVMNFQYRNVPDSWANFEDIKLQEYDPSSSTGWFPERKIFFECPDRSKGIVIKWTKDGGEKLKCFNRY